MRSPDSITQNVTDSESPDDPDAGQFRGFSEAHPRVILIGPATGDSGGIPEWDSQVSGRILCRLVRRKRIVDVGGTRVLGETAYQLGRLFIRHFAKHIGQD